MTAPRNHWRRGMPLPQTLWGYRAMGTEPAPADCLGERGLPETRDALDALWRLLEDILRVASPHSIAGGTLVERLGIRDTRALRLLVAYGRIHHQQHRIVGVPGSGYVWAGELKALYRAAAADAQRRGRCYFYLVSLYKRQGIATAMAQLALDFVSERTADGVPHADDLAALAAAEGVGPADVLDALIGELAASPEGRQAIERVAARRADVLLTPEVRRGILNHLDAVRQAVAGPA